MKSQYAHEDVCLIFIKKNSSNEICMQYSYLVESSAYSNGVNYEIKDDTLFIAINRCMVGKDNSPMIKSIPIEDDSITEQGFIDQVVIPFNGEKVVMRYSDIDVELTIEK